jgi:hypothetical protein
VRWNARLYRPAARNILRCPTEGVDGMTIAIPDPLRRFVPTPYGCVLTHESDEVQIESNNSAFAEQLLNACRTSPSTSLLRYVEYLKIIVDPDVTQNGDQLTHVDANRLHTLLLGTSTMLIHDTESRELFAFLAPQVSCHEFVRRLLPAVLRVEQPPLSLG